jgi:RimJ/RimL family protein N-acetyltransferase
MTPPRIALRRMNASEFKRYVKAAIPEYADAHIRAGDVDSKEALKKAKKEYAELLPKGVATPGHHLYTITIAHSGAPVGMLWFDLKHRHGKIRSFIFDFRLDEAFRGKGLGRQALELLEQQARILGAVLVGLHVFGDNLAARNLYERSGFRCASMTMSKELAPGLPEHRRRSPFRPKGSK